MPAVIARIAHTYGPTMDIDNDPRVFASFIKNAVNRENIVIKSDGNAKRSFCYISDATTAFLKLLIEGKPGEAYNVCNAEQTVSIKELGKVISNLASVGLMYQKRPEDDVYLQDKNTGATIYSNEKLRKLGFSFKVDLQQGFSRVLTFAKEI